MGQAQPPGVHTHTHPMQTPTAGSSLLMRSARASAPRTGQQQQAPPAAAARPPARRSERRSVAGRGGSPSSREEETLPRLALTRLRPPYRSVLHLPCSDHESVSAARPVSVVCVVRAIVARTSSVVLSCGPAAAAQHCRSQWIMAVRSALLLLTSVSDERTPITPRWKKRIDDNVYN